MAFLVFQFFDLRRLLCALGTLLGNPASKLLPTNSCLPRRILRQLLRIEWKIELEGGFSTGVIVDALKVPVPAGLTFISEGPAIKSCKQKEQKEQALKSTGM